MILLLDNFDSFTYNLVDYFNQLGLNVQVRRNDEVSVLEEAAQYKAIVLSPGPGKPQDAGVMPSLIQKYVDSKPILGICLGHQALVCHFGGRLVKAQRPMHGKISVINLEQNGLFAGIPMSTRVVRYHSLVCTDLPLMLQPLATSVREQELMAFGHKYLPVYGLQFHPEAVLTEYGLKILENWANVTKIIN